MFECKGKLRITTGHVIMAGVYAEFMYTNVKVVYRMVI